MNDMLKGLVGKANAFCKGSCWRFHFDICSAHFRLQYLTFVVLISDFSRISLWGYDSDQDSCKPKNRAELQTFQVGCHSGKW